MYAQDNILCQFGLINLSSVQQLISQPILIHFWWELYHHISTGSLGGQVPLQVLYGVTPDISIMLLYTFYQPIFYAAHDQHFPSESEERAGYWIGFAEHCGDSLTHKVLDAETLKNYSQKCPQAQDS